MGYIGAGPTRFNTADELTVTGDAEFNGNLTVKGTHITLDSATVQTVDLGDNDKIRLGDGDDLQIYHDGTKSVIADVTGAGNFHIRGSNVLYIQSDDGGENYAVFNDNGSASLYYDNSAKLATTSTGVDVTGTVQGDGLVIDGATVLNGNATIDQGALSGNTLSLDRTGADGTLGFFNSGTQTALISGVSGGGINAYVGSTPSLAMTIDSSGNVGIGVTPFANNIGKGLDIASGAGMFGSSNSNYLTGNLYYSSGWKYKASAGGALVLLDSASSIKFFTAASGTAGGAATLDERMRIDSSGNLLLGTAFSGFNSRQTTRFESSGVVVGHTFWNGGGSGQKFIEFVSSGGGSIGSITQSGASSTAYNTSSDYRLKENVTADWDATTRLKQLNPVRFNFISDADTTVDGFLAHEVQDVVPEAISGTKDGMRDEEYTVSEATGDIYTPATEAVLDEDGNEVTPAVAEVIHSTDVERPEELAEGQQWRETTAAVMSTRSVPAYQGIDQSKLVPLLVKTIQELEARIVALETA
jgi:hypothetical protein